METFNTRQGIPLDDSAVAEGLKLAASKMESFSKAISAGKAVRAVMLYTRDGSLWAVELEDGWIPRRALPLAPEQAMCDLDALDWANAINTPTWNVANMVMLCDSGRRRYAEGRQIRTRKASAKRVDLPAVAITERLTLEDVKERVEEAEAESDAKPAFLA